LGREKTKNVIEKSILSLTVKTLKKKGTKKLMIRAFPLFVPSFFHAGENGSY